MKLLTTSVITAGLVLIAAQTQAATVEGNWELSGLASYAHTWADVDDGDSADFSEYLGMVGLGYYVSDALEVKATTAFVGMSGEGMDAFAILLMAGADYHFMTDRDMVPYVGAYGGGVFADADFAGLDDSTTGFVFDIHAGLKQFVAANVAIDYRISYQYMEIEDVTLSNLMAMIGINFQF
jgi:hypothetical protein